MPTPDDRPESAARPPDAVAAWEALFRAQVAVMRTLSAEFPTREITLTEYDVLFNLVREPARRLRLRELNRQVLLTQSSVSRLVDRLVDRGLLAKEADPSDARATLVMITAEGEALFRRVAVDHMASIRRRVGGALDGEELAALARLCERLRGA